MQLMFNFPSATDSPTDASQSAASKSFIEQLKFPLNGLPIQRRSDECLSHHQSAKDPQILH